MKITCSFEYLVRDFLGCTFSISLNDSTLSLLWSCLWFTIWDWLVVKIGLLLVLLLLKQFFLNTVWDWVCSFEWNGSLKFSSHWKSFLSKLEKKTKNKSNQWINNENNYISNLGLLSSQCQQRHRAWYLSY